MLKFKKNMEMLPKTHNKFNCVLISVYIFRLHQILVKKNVFNKLL